MYTEIALAALGHGVHWDYCPLFSAQG